ncbi:hypothetical protein U9M48_023026 [Paspalum notatum var. saurae]|uniref:Uncharacterized protein n=1 Tax=Paspalum notatum var. saurae TaxID=547442 RepID=A0AAQ3TKU1_PASNO
MTGGRQGAVRTQRRRTERVFPSSISPDLLSRIPPTLSTRPLPWPGRRHCDTARARSKPRRGCLGSSAPPPLLRQAPLPSARSVQPFPSPIQRY